MMVYDACMSGDMMHGDCESDSIMCDDWRRDNDIVYVLVKVMMQWLCV